MKIIKKVIQVILITSICLIIGISYAKATTKVTVSTETLNLRKEASTDSEIVALLSSGDTAELIEESGDWYKVKYKTYTGYVSKEYVKKQNQDDQNNQVNKEESNSTSKDVELDNSTDNENDSISGKINTETDIRLLPLIYASNIEKVAKNTSVTVVTELNGWSYVQTSNVTGWVRSETISVESKATNSTNTTKEVEEEKSKSSNKSEEDKNKTENKTEQTSQASQNSQTSEKAMYTNDSYVNLRKQPSTSSDIVMVVAINTKLTVIGESGDWYKINTSEGNAYVLKTLLSSKPLTTTRGGAVKTLSQNNDSKSNNTIKTNNSTTTVKKNTTSNNNTSSNAKSTSNTSSKTASTKATTSSSSSKGNQIVSYAKQFLGVPYVYGGASKSGFDCSGFTMYVYKKFGISMRHGAQAQAKLGKTVSYDKKSSSSIKNNLKAGDLVFFLDNSTMSVIGHVGIYIGNGDFIHASSGSGYCVKISSLLPGEYYNTRFCGARRII